MEQWSKNHYRDWDLCAAPQATGHAILDEDRPQGVALRASAGRRQIPATADCRHSAGENEHRASGASASFTDLSTPTGSISTTIGVGARRAVAALRALQIDPVPLLVRAGLHGADLDDRGVRIGAVAEAQLIETAAEVAGDPTFGLRLATSGSSKDTGLIYYCLAASPSFRETVRLLPGYFQIVNESARWSAKFTPEGDAIVELRYSGLLRRKLKHATEYHVAAIVQHLRDFVGRDFNLGQVSFAHFRANGVKQFEHFFRCPVEFGADADRFVLSRATLAMPSCRADGYLFQTLRPFVEEMAKARSASARPYRDAVDNELFRTLPRGEPKIETVARSLGVTPRTLSRRLADEGMPFAEVLTNIRQSLAIEYLKEPDVRVDQIALLLGYSDVASFSHAFRRWTGVAPSVARRVAAVTRRQ